MSTPEDPICYCCDKPLSQHGPKGACGGARSSSFSTPPEEQKLPISPAREAAELEISEQQRHVPRHIPVGTFVQRAISSAVAEDRVTIERLTAENAQLIETIQLAYLKHHCDSDVIGWDALADRLGNDLQNVMGDDAYQLWIAKNNQD